MKVHLVLILTNKIDLIIKPIIYLLEEQFTQKTTNNLLTLMLFQYYFLSYLHKIDILKWVHFQAPLQLNWPHPMEVQLEYIKGREENLG